MRCDEREGTKICERLNENGIAAFMLRYRVYPYHYPAQLYDIQRAVRLARYLAPELGIDSDKIGILGFSAGGHLCTMGVELYDYGKDTGDAVDRVSCRPDFGVLCYPVATADLPFSEPRTIENLLRETDHTDELRHLVSGENHVRDDGPPVFIWHTAEDQLVRVENSLAMAQALSAKNIPYELHVFPEGCHGLDLAVGHPGAEQWVGLLLNWLERLGL